MTYHQCLRNYFTEWLFALSFLLFFLQISPLLRCLIISNWRSTKDMQLHYHPMSVRNVPNQYQWLLLFCIFSRNPQDSTEFNQLLCRRSVPRCLSLGHYPRLSVWYKWAATRHKCKFAWGLNWSLFPLGSEKCILLFLDWMESLFIHCLAKKPSY